MIFKISGANTIPQVLVIMVIIKATSNDCIPACAAASGFFSPVLRATIAVAAVLKPIATE